MSPAREDGAARLHTVDDVRELTFKNFTDARGTLVPIEALNDFPFEIKRVFYIRPKRANDTRGKHGHYRCSQLLICTSGACRVIVQDGVGRREFRLDSLDRGLLIPPTLWAEEIYESADTVLLVLCDRLFERDDYIDEEADFQALRASGARP
jgi:dTDP-4-dehydrorhamnose 3,5-epimerase-like enzyme